MSDFVHPKKKLREDAIGLLPDSVQQQYHNIVDSPPQEGDIDQEALRKARQQVEQAQTTELEQVQQQVQQQQQQAEQATELEQAQQQVQQQQQAEQTDATPVEQPPGDEDETASPANKQSSLQKRAYPMAPPSQSSSQAGVSQKQMLRQFEQVRRQNPRLARQLVQYLVGSVPVAGPPAAGVTGMLQSPKGTSGGSGSFLGSSFGQVAGGMAGAGLGDMLSAGSRGSAGRLLSMIGGGLLGTTVGGGLGSVVGFNEATKQKPRMVRRKTSSYDDGYADIVQRL